MKINKSNSKNSLFYILPALLIIVALCIIYLFLIRTPTGTDKDEIDYNKPSNEQIEAGTEIKKETVEQDEESQSNNSDEPASSASFKTRITSTSAQSNSLRIRNVIDGIYQQGACSLVLTKGSQTVERSASVQPLPQNSTCKGFDIPLSELSTGQWQAKLTVEINNQVATTSTVVEIP